MTGKLYRIIFTPISLSAIKASFGLFTIVSIKPDSSVRSRLSERSDNRADSRDDSHAASSAADSTAGGAHTDSLEGSSFQDSSLQGTAGQGTASEGEKHSDADQAASVPTDSTNPHALAGSWVVGAFLGAVVGLTISAFSPYVGAFPASFIGLSLGIVLSGCMHYDALADVADSVSLRTNQARRREVARDSSIGAFGGVALVMALGYHVSVLHVIAASSTTMVLIAWCAAAGILSRVAISVAVLSASPAEPTKGSGILIQAADRYSLIGSVLWGCGVAGALVALGYYGYHFANDAAFGTVRMLVMVAAAIVGISGTLLIARILVRVWVARYGGLTGDTLGATQQAGELVVLTLIVIMI